MKKIVVATAIGVVSFSAFAQDGVVASQNNTFAYASINAGIADKHMKDEIISGDRLPPGGSGLSVSHANTAWALGGSVGYQFLNHLALEFGGNRLASASVSDSSSAKARSLDSWLGYLAAKMSVPIYTKLNLFGKAGVGYQDMSGSYFDHSQSLDPSTNLKHAAWVPVFAVGANYNINRSIFAGLQYMRYGSLIRQNNNGDSWVFTAKDLLTANLGYKFQM